MSTFSDSIQHAQMESTSSYTSNSQTATWSSSNLKSGLSAFGNASLLDPTLPSPPFTSEPQLLALGVANGNVAAAPTAEFDFARTIPPNNVHRTLVLCFDGTGDQFDSDNSNIVELFSMLKKDDPDKQLVYYQAGIGTYTTPEIATPFMSSISKNLDMAVAWNLDSHIMGGYEFLMQNYRTNDKICIFGFSRGAYTARCLAGMLHKVGLLPTCNHQQVPFAYKMYTQADDDGWKMSNAFKRTFSIDVDIEFLGVWDTVNSVGLLPRRLPFTTSNSVVKTFRHALALDERRAKFKPNHWNRPTPEELVLSESDKKNQELLQKLYEEQTHAHNGDHDHSQDRAEPEVKSKPTKKNSDLKKLEMQYAVQRVKETDVEEVWFTGCHCDIGGGSVADGTSPCLARIPLRWMIREIFKAKTGILFHVGGFKRIGMDPTKLYPDVVARPPALPLSTYSVDTSIIQDIPKNASTTSKPEGTEDILYGAAIDETEEEADLKDALAPIYDQLKLAWGWWALEIMPMHLHYQAEKVKEDTAEKSWEWKKELHMNLGRGRHVPRQKKDGVKVHRSVKTRLEAADKNGRKYKPAAVNLNFEHVIWVD